MKEPIRFRKGATLPRTPLYHRIALDLRRRITAGDLPRGIRLPSSRALAKQLGVSRNTVVNAYDALAAEGLLATRIGSGTRVLAAAPARLDPRRLLRDAHYPTAPVRLHDPDGNPVYFHR
jgi:DNA-binding GntR family transcriptional regulator